MTDISTTLAAADTSTKPLAVVTGASSGIGFELAKQFGQNGFDLLVNAEDAGLEEAARHLRTTGATVYLCQADLTSAEGVDKLYSAILGTGRPLDAIALNA